MDNLTHSLVGLAAAKAGLERTSHGATALCLVAANAPDADIVMLLFGRWSYLHHHRGLSHAVVGVAVIAILLPLLFYGVERLSARLSRRPSRANLCGLLLSSVILSASHPLMDWTNNYGVRPFLPWDARWLYGDLVFIIDPWLWLTLGGAAFLLTARGRWRIVAWALLASVITAAIFFLPARSNVGYPQVSRLLWLVGLAALFLAHRARLAARFGGALAVGALVFVLFYWGALALLHERALARARLDAEEMARRAGERVVRVAAMPRLADPLRWICVAETERAFVRYGVSLLDAEEEAPREVARFEKTSGEAAPLVESATKDERARIFLDFARFAAVRFSRDCLGQTLVQFADLRFTEPGGRSDSFSLEVPLAAEGP